MNILGLPILYYLDFFPSKPTDFSFGLIEKLGIDNEIKNGSWDVIEKKVSQLSADDVSRVIEGICRAKEYHPHIEQYLKTERSEFQNLIAGNYYTIVAWEIRSGKWATEVTGDQWEGFFEYLEKAEERLDGEFRNKIWRLEGAALMIRVCLGQSEKDRAFRCFEKCKQLAPNHLLAHQGLFRVLTPRWLGSDEEMIEFYQSIPHPKLSRLIQFEMLIEMYSDLQREDEEMAYGRFREQRMPLIKSALNQVGIMEGDSMFAISYNNHLACLLNIMRMKNQRDKILKALKEKITYRPWVYFGMSSERDIRLFKMGGLL